MDRQHAEVHLKKVFGHDTFHDEQWMVIEKLLKGERVLLIEKTGFGKSLCYQFPATLFDGTTVIFSPLIALMREQVKKLNELSIPTRCINSEQSKETNEAIIEEAIQGKIKILYIAPERQESDFWLDRVRHIKLSMVVVDEAHCISVWGYDFRPSYRRIIKLVNLLPRSLPVLATTATVTPRVQKDIEKQVGDHLTVIRGNLMRENLKLYVIKVRSEEEKMLWIGEHLTKLRDAGIVYTGQRSDTEIYQRWLDYLKIPCVAYHAGLEPNTRTTIENEFTNNKWKCVVATNALGMGIDKPDIGFIIHTRAPQSPIHYYQEIGRAGRDGRPATIILFFDSTSDEELWDTLLSRDKPSLKKYSKIIDLIRNELLTETEIINRLNIERDKFQIVKTDLIEQNIIREITISKRKMFEYIFGAPAFNSGMLEEFLAAKLADLKSMRRYIETERSRMNYLCEFLGDPSDKTPANCDNTALRKLYVLRTARWDEKIQEFRDNFYLELDLATECMVKGIAASYYGFSTIGSIIHLCKYQKAGDYPDYLLKLTLNAFRQQFGEQHFDLIVYVPPTRSGNLVKNFAEKISQTLQVPISHNLIKHRRNHQQKIFKNNYLKRENVKNVFIFREPEEIKGKNVLLIDDICDSGATLKEIGEIFRTIGVSKIAPVVIAKTIRKVCR